LALTRAESLPFVTVQPSRTIPQPDYNQATVDAAGDIYTTDGLRGYYKYHPDGTAVELSADPALTFTVGITVDSTGDIYVSNFADATIHKYDSSGRPLLTWTVDHGLTGPAGLTHDVHDNILVALHRVHQHYIEKYSPDGELLATWAPLGASDGEIGGAPSDGPSEITVDREGNSYITDPVNNRLVSFAPDGKFRLNFTGAAAHPLISPVTIAVDHEGNVYTESGLMVWKFDPTGALVGRWFTPTMGSLVIDPQDRVLQVNKQIWQLSFPSA
jgi:streptogramin lyase